MAGSKRIVRHWTGRDWDSDVRQFETEGRTLHYLDHGSGPPLVLLHGMACCWQWWLECVPELAAHHRVLAVDLPGFGQSDPLPPPASMDTHAAMVHRLLDHLGLAATTVVGHSMGGLVAIAMATAQPDRVERLALVGSGGVPMSERHLRRVLKILRLAHRGLTRPAVLRALARSARARAVLLRGALHDPRSLSPELAREVVPLLGAPGFLPAITASAAAVRAARPELIGTPTLLVWGEHDRFAPLHTAEAMHRLLPDSRLAVIPGVGHTPMVEAPGEFTRILLQFTQENPLSHKENP